MVQGPQGPPGPPGPPGYSQLFGSSTNVTNLVEYIKGRVRINWLLKTIKAFCVTTFYYSCSTVHGAIVGAPGRPGQKGDLGYPGPRGEKGK